jgi:exopolysaccharide biosynthesis protein
MKIFLKKQISVIFILLIFSSAGICQKIDLDKQQLLFDSDGVKVYQLNSDTLFREKQHIFVAEWKPAIQLLDKLEIAWSDSLLKKTSRFGLENNAIVALNGSFFDVEKGGSVAYLESNGQVIARNRNSKEKWAKTDSLLNGAIVIEKSGKLRIEIAKPLHYYEESDQEKAVLVSGPILLAGGQLLPLENSEFVNKRHPRSCLCETSSSDILFIAVDGRSEIASGMNLKELQRLLLKLQCSNAINLDGGGSTTLWVDNGKTQAIINQPSDKAGERPVSNILLIKAKK